MPLNCTLVELKWFKTHAIACILETLNCTLVELKFKRVLRIVRQSFSKLYLSGIEIKDLLKKYHTLAALNCTLVELKSNGTASAV